MSSERQKRIEERAYALWQAEGRPHGRHEEHWRRAAHEIETEETASKAVNRTPPRARRGAANSGSRSPQHRKKARA
jgi:Protein of unknown function (DUF2934)